MISKEPTLKELRAKCREYVSKGHTELRGYSTAPRSALQNSLASLERLAALPKVPETKEVAGPAPTPAPVVPGAPIPKVKREPSVWNKYCKEHGLIPGKPLTPEQKEAYAKYKAKAAETSV